MELNTEQIQFVKRCLNDYLSLRGANAGKSHLSLPFVPDDCQQAVLSQLSADVDHSALLPRLLSGKSALTKPPPRAYSSPWYELVEQGSAALCKHDVYICDSEDIEAFGFAYVVICGMQWGIVEARSAFDFIICTPDGHNKATLIKVDGRWQLSLIQEGS